MKSITAIAAQVRKEAKLLGLAILDGSVEEDTRPFEVCVSQDSENSADVFLAMAKLANAQLILIHEDLLAMEDIDGVEDDVSSLKRHLGEAHAIRLIAVPPGLTPLVSLTLSADWAATLFADNRPDTSGSGDQRVLSAEEMDLAHQLAADPRFPDADYRIRDALMKRLAPTAAEPHRIVSAAEEIWQLDLRPKRDAELREKALALLEQGLPKNKIVPELGLKSTYALNKLLGQA